MEQDLGKVFSEYERTWRQRRSGAEAATQDSINRIRNGEEIIFAYPWANSQVVDRIVKESGAVGQFSLPYTIDGASDPMLHVKL